jgi:hypothetical protein
MEDEPLSSLTRRGFVTAAGAAAAAAATVAAPQVAAASESIARTGAARPLGSGGRPTINPTLARLAREHGRGEPVMFVDLAAVDQNAKVIIDFARAQR